MQVAITETTDNIEQTRTLIRQRRALEEAIQDRREDLIRTQDIGRKLLEQFVNPENAEAGAQFEQARADIRSAFEALQRAEASLKTFAEENPTSEELAERERKLVYEADQRQRREIRIEFASTVRERIELLDRAHQAELEARKIFAKATKQWPQGTDLHPSAAGIHQDLAFTDSNGFFELFNHIGGVLSAGPRGTYFTTWRKKAEAWLAQHAADVESTEVR